jgi:lactate dehydrogenase-like 2-hydroxyacid dehydrogenase
MKILVSYAIPKEPFAKLPSDWAVTFPENEYLSDDELLAQIPDYDVLLASFNRKVPNAVIDAGKNLKLISNFGVGFNNIDVAYARQKGISVTNTPKAVTNPTAEHAFAMLLTASLRIAECNMRLRSEKEAMWGMMKNLGRSVEGKTLGIIGMGRIGQSVARKAEAFDMDVIYHNSNTRIEGFTFVELNDLLKRSDYISIHTPYNPSTHHLIGARQFEMMKPTAIVINTACGSVVDENALVEALKSETIAGAALDVFENEPSITADLYAMPNVVLTPHTATGTIETRTKTSAEAVLNILNFVQGNPTNVVN